MTYIGVDPGLDGAVAVISSKGIYLGVYDIPSMARTKSNKRKVNSAGLSQSIKAILAATKDEFVTVVIENVWAMPKQGATSGCSIGHSLGVLEGAFNAAAVFSDKMISVEMVHSTRWKKHFKLTSDKEQSRAKAISLFPEAPLERKKDTDRAEALLIARYALEINAARNSNDAI